MIRKDQGWNFVITPQEKKYRLNLKEIYQYRDLLYLFIRRDIVSIYKQTILGPVWLVIQPLFTSATQLVIFSKIASIPSDGVPYFLFVFQGNILWNYFATSLTSIADTFKQNEQIFGKVYFPRAIVPLSITLSNIFKFFIQFFIFILILIFYLYTQHTVQPNLFILLTPLVLTSMALISMGMGMIITSVTTKYRDFTHILGFGITLIMYATPVVYPTSLFLEKMPPQNQWIIYLNPLTGIFDLFKYAFLGSGNINWYAITWSGLFSISIYTFGLLLFNKTEKSFMDTI